MTDLRADDVVALIDLADAVKARPHGHRDALAGETLVALLERPSTRTQLSLAVAAQRCGMHAETLHADELQLGRGETLEDTAQVLGRYATLVAVRTGDHDLLVRLAAACPVPVISGGSHEHHPLQALAGLMTLRERFGRLSGVRLAYVGTATGVARSLMEAAALTGLQVVLSCPRWSAPTPEEVRRLDVAATLRGGLVRFEPSPQRAVEGAHAVHTDVWGPMDDEARPDARTRELLGFRVDDELLRHARPEAIFLHCLPALRGQEVAAEVIDGPRSAVFEQAENRLHTAQALLLRTLARATA